MNYQKLADELLRFRAFQQECHESVVRCFETFNMIANMEKKTKKMTKAEAFEWLKETKVRCYEERSNSLYANLVAKMTACGCEYDGFLSPPTASVWAVVVSGNGKICHLPTVNADNYNLIDFKEIPADDILSIEIVEEDEHKFSDYVAILQSQLGDNKVTVITKTNFITLVK